MSYMRYGSELRWFKGKSEEYVYGTYMGETKKALLYDGISTLNDSPEQWIELIGRIIYRETNDPDFTDKVVIKLAKKYEVDNKLRYDFLHPLGMTRYERDPYKYFTEKEE